MQLERYYSEQDGKLLFTRQQASDFAKRVAGDFNPIHDTEASRFCVPGDLLLSILLAKIGISEHIQIHFNGMISANTPLKIVETEHEVTVVDENQKLYLTLTRRGAVRHDPALANEIAQHYVQFSGKNFPHIMVPLMREQQMMINTDRPLVMYESMSLSFDDLQISSAEVALSSSTMSVNGKRGKVDLSFDFMVGDRRVGHGCKTMVASGLRPYCEDAIQDLVERFNARKQAYCTT
ncbi:DUF3581 family protein [Salinivibrio sp. IB872]|uniref:DUF3581 family protein n=1 Tax=Salinivibrio sp. IB872 TaxID=1766123 RepID=UPI0009848AB0|nr:DUF3581 family protein [Salinivibrio sp. IB872]OOF27057.1 hypothetical protein BZJ18_08730 [Salinivibrio sp. IB872]